MLSEIIFAMCLILAILLVFAVVAICKKIKQKNNCDYIEDDESFIRVNEDFAKGGYKPQLEDPEKTDELYGHIAVGMIETADDENSPAGLTVEEAAENENIQETSETGSEEQDNFNENTADNDEPEKSLNEEELVSKPTGSYSYKPEQNIDDVESNRVDAETKRESASVENRIVIVYRQNTLGEKFTIAKDNKTGVLYLINASGAMCPMLDADGKPLLIPDQ